MDSGCMPFVAAESEDINPKCVVEGLRHHWGRLFQVPQPSRLLLPIAETLSKTMLGVERLKSR